MARERVFQAQRVGDDSPDFLHNHETIHPPEKGKGLPYRERTLLGSPRGSEQK